MADKREFGIGLIGLGIGQQHLLGYQRQNLRVAAICDKDTTRLNEIGNTFGVDKRYTRIADLIADTDVNVVDMAVQPWIRSPIVKAAAEAGKHILCQKPFSMSMQQAVEMVNISERHNVQLMVNQNSCFVPGFLAIEPYINAEHLGEIYHVSITCNGFYTEFPERHLIPAMQVHHIGLIHKWFGEYESVTVKHTDITAQLRKEKPFPSRFSKVGTVYRVCFRVTGHSLPIPDATYSTRTRKSASKARKGLSTETVMT